MSRTAAPSHPLRSILGSSRATSKVLAQLRNAPPRDERGSPQATAAPAGLIVADVTKREEGHVLTGEPFVVTVDGKATASTRMEQAVSAARAVDWGVHDVVCTAVDAISSRARDDASP